MMNKRRADSRRRSYYSLYIW